MILRYSRTLLKKKLFIVEPFSLSQGNIITELPMQLRTCRYFYYMIFLKKIQPHWAYSPLVSIFYECIFILIRPALLGIDLPNGNGKE